MDAMRKIEEALAAIKGAQTLKALAEAQEEYGVAVSIGNIREVLQTLASKEAEIARLRAALEPFVDYPAETLTLETDEGFTMTVRGFHLHNAVAALTQPPKEPT